MTIQTTDRFSRLGAIQLAVLAVGASTIAALAVAYALRRLNVVRAPAPNATPGVDHTGSNGQVAMPAQPPNHFSEDLVVPGRTYTGPEIVEQVDDAGQSPEGV